LRRDRDSPSAAKWKELGFDIPHTVPSQEVLDDVPTEKLLFENMFHHYHRTKDNKVFQNGRLGTTADNASLATVITQLKQPNPDAAVYCTNLHGNVGKIELPDHIPGNTVYETKLSHALNITPQGAIVDLHWGTLPSPFFPPFGKKLVAKV
jgi:hypothetical protein